MNCAKCGYQFQDGESVCPNCAETVSKKDAVIRKAAVLFSKEKTWYIVVVILAAISLAFTFGSISKTRVTIRLSDNVLKYSYNTNSIQMYEGYYIGTFLKDDYDFNQQHLELIEIFEEIWPLENAQDYSYLASNAYHYQEAVLYSIGNGTYIDSIDFLVEIVLLLIVQLLPIVIIVTATYLYIKKKSVFKMQRLFLIGGLTGILLSGLLNNHYEKRTSIGSGLLIYIIFMFLSYLIMKAWELHTSKKLSGKKIIVYLSRISFGFILIGLLFSSFLRINYNDQSNYNANTNYRLTDVIDLSFYTESRSPFNLMSVIPWKVYSERVYEFADYPETDNSDIRSKLNSMDLTILPFSVFVGVEPVVQTILLGITTILAILSIGLSLLMQYVVMIDRDYKKRKLRRNLQILITILIGVLIGISIFMKIKMNYSNTVGYSNLSAHVSTGLVIAFFVSVAIVIYEKHRLKIKKVT